jgi:hypothetical protein
VINVRSKNTKPQALSFTAEVNMNSWKAVNLSGSDADGDWVICSVVKGPKNGELSGMVPHLSYKPKFGFKGKDTFTFRVNDGNANSAVATVTLNVIKISNQLPVVPSKSYTATAGKALRIALTASDPDGEATTFRVLSNPTSGKLTGKGANLRYLPLKSSSGTVSFTYVANDGTGDSAPATITINVTGPRALAGKIEKSAQATALPNLALAPLPGRNDLLVLQVRGDPGSQWTLEKSDDLKSWVSERDLVVDENGRVDLDIPLVPEERRMFYRLREP